jgi:hypothetical protein
VLRNASPVLLPVTTPLDNMRDPAKAVREGVNPEPLVVSSDYPFEDDGSYQAANCRSVLVLDLPEPEAPLHHKVRHMHGKGPEDRCCHVPHCCWTPPSPKVDS